MSIIKGQSVPKSVLIDMSDSELSCEGIFLHEDGRCFYLEAHCQEVDIDMVKAEMTERLIAQAIRWENYYDSISGALNISG